MGFHLSTKTKAFLTIILMGPFFGEVLSMSTPLFVFLLPWVLFFLILLYGFGLLLIHEIRVHYNRSTTSVILLGVVYGFLEEGVSLRSFFDPNWGITPLDVYGRVFGVNMVWAASVTLYHVGMSIWIPLMIFDILFPEYQNQPLLETKRQQVIVVILYFLSLGIFYLINKYSQPFLPYLILVLLTLILYIIALKLPSPDPTHQAPVTSSAIRLYLSGFVGFFLWVTYSWFFPPWNINWIASFILLWLIPPFVIILAGGWKKHWTKRQQLIFATGVLTPILILFPMLSEPIEQTIASLITVWILWLAYKKSRNPYELNEP